MEYCNRSVVIAVILPEQLSVAVGVVEITVWQSPEISGKLVTSGMGDILSDNRIVIIDFFFFYLLIVWLTKYVPEDITLLESKIFPWESYHFRFSPFSNISDIL